MHSGVFEFNLRRNGVDTSIILDAAKWNCAGGKLTSCVINTIPLVHVLCYFFYPLHLYVFILICQYYVVLLERTNKDIIYIIYYNIRNTFGTNLPLCLCFLCIMICMHSFHSAHIFKVCNSVIRPSHSKFDYGHIVLNYTAHIVYSPLNLYAYIHWILDFKYILLLLHC